MNEASHVVPNGRCYWCGARIDNDTDYFCSDECQRELHCASAGAQAALDELPRIRADLVREMAEAGIDATNW